MPVRYAYVQVVVDEVVPLMNRQLSRQKTLADGLGEWAAKNAAKNAPPPVVHNETLDRVMTERRRRNSGQGFKVASRAVIGARTIHEGADGEEWQHKSQAGALGRRTFSAKEQFQKAESDVMKRLTLSKVSAGNAPAKSASDADAALDALDALVPALPAGLTHRGRYHGENPAREEAGLPRVTTWGKPLELSLRRRIPLAQLAHQTSPMRIWLSSKHCKPFCSEREAGIRYTYEYMIKVISD